MTDRTTKRNLIMAGIAITALTAAASATAWHVSGAAGVNELKVDQFDTKHLSLEWVLTFEAKENTGKVNVSITKPVMKIVAKTGQVTFAQGGITQNTETDRPSCTTTCWGGYAAIEGRSYPGINYAYVSWTRWDFFPTMILGGETDVTFKMDAPSKWDGPNPATHDWTPYGTWELSVSKVSLRYASTTWGHTHTYHDDGKLVEKWTVVKP